MSMPSDVTPDITEAREGVPRRAATSIPPAPTSRGAGRRLLGQLTPQQGALAATALATFVGVAFLGPLLARLTTPKSRAQKLKDEAAFRAETMRRRARKTGARMRKQARRLGGGTVRR